MSSVGETRSVALRFLLLQWQPVWIVKGEGTIKTYNSTTRRPVESSCVRTTYHDTIRQVESLSVSSAVHLVLLLCLLSSWLTDLCPILTIGGPFLLTRHNAWMVLVVGVYCPLHSPGLLQPNFEPSTDVYERKAIAEIIIWFVLRVRVIRWCNRPLTIKILREIEVLHRSMAPCVLLSIDRRAGRVEMLITML